MANGKGSFWLVENPTLFLGLYPVLLKYMFTLFQTYSTSIHTIDTQQVSSNISVVRLRYDHHVCIQHSAWDLPIYCSR